MLNLTIEPYKKQCKTAELWDFIEDNLRLKGFPKPMYWVSHSDIVQRRKNNEIFLAMQGGKMLGCVIIKKENIEILCVRKRYRRKGIGKALIEHVVAILARDKRRKYIKVDSLCNFGVKEFYEKLGFTDYISNVYDYTWHLKKAL